MLDSGREEKLERFGDVLLARPDPQALWEKRLSASEWEEANGVYKRESGPSTSSGQAGKWTGNLPKEWQIEFGGLNFLIKPTSFKHTGLFPEQLSNWEWVAKTLEARRSVSQADGPRSSEFSAENYATPEGLLDSKPSILNLFAYTGGATLAAAQAGAKVTHVDASKTAVAWAKQNAELSGLQDAPIRWITEDALTFVQREIKRGTTYDAIIMDPPAFGHGPAGELWKIEENFLELMKLVPQLLSEQPLFVLINGYAAGYSPLAFAYNLESLSQTFGGSIEYGDLEIAHSNSSGQAEDRVLPCGIFARWVR